MTQLKCAMSELEGAPAFEVSDRLPCQMLPPVGLGVWDDDENGNEVVGGN